MSSPVRATKNSSSCLFCFDPCPDYGISDNIFQSPIPGAGKSWTLRRQLIEFFILSKLLDIDNLWLEENVLLKSGEGIGDERQLKVCGKCMTFVEQAWKLHQQIVELQTQLNGIKSQAKNEMRRLMVTQRRSSRWGVEDGINCDVRVAVFPELVPKSEEYSPENFSESDVVVVEGECFDEDYSDAEDGMNFIEGHDDDDFDEDKSFVQKRSKKRKKGLKVKRGASKVLNKNSSFKKTCTKCVARLMDESDVAQHMKLHAHREETGEDVELNCEVCSFPAIDKAGLRIHMMNCHKEYQKKVWECPESECNLKVESWKVLKSHVETHHPDLNLSLCRGSENKDKAIEGLADKDKVIAEFLLTCTKCSIKFPTSQTYLVHMRKEHEGFSKVLQCTDCSKKFVTSSGLHTHVLRDHMKTRRYVCDECGAGFTRRFELKRHKGFKHSQGANRIICDLCGLDYVDVNVLKLHIQKFHSDGKVSKRGETEELHKCNYCDLVTPFKLVLRRHLAKHKEELGNKCDQCGKCYTKPEGLKRHVRIVHTKEKISVECEYCNKSYPSIQHMREHQSRYCKAAIKIKEVRTVISDPSQVNLPNANAECSKVKTHQ